MNDTPGAVGTVLTHDDLADRGATKRTFVVIAGSGAMLGAIAGVAIAVPLAAAEGLAVFLATAIDIAAGLALIGGLIGAKVAGTD
jgi:hypothetical protein